MLIVLVQAQVAQGALEAGLDAMNTMVETSRAEEGCVSYDFAQDVFDPLKLHIVERWKDEAALAFHFQTPHMAEFQKATAGLGLQLTEALKFQADEGSPLM